MANFYARYSSGSASGATVTANQGTSPWVVSGTVAATQSGTWNVNNISGTVSLPTGAATAAKQPAIGTAGTSSTDVLSVQGVSGGTPMPISGSITANNASVGTTGAAVPASATMIGGTDGTNLRAAHVSAAGLVSVDASGATVTVSGTVAATQSGTWNVGLSAGSNLVGKVGIDQTTPGTTNGVQINAAIPAGANTIGAVTQASGPWTNNVTQFGGTNISTGTGTGGAGIPRVTVSSDSNVLATQSGTWNIGTVTTVSTVTAVTAITNALPAGTNAIGSVIQTATAAATFQAEGNVAAGSVTNSYVTLFTPSASTKILYLRNNTNQPIGFSFDAGTTTNFILDSGDQVAIDYVGNGMIASTSAIQVKYTGSAPTTGSVRINGCH